MGLKPRTVRRWIALGKKGGAGSKPFVAFLAAVRAAEVHAVDVHLGLLEKHARKGNVAASTFLLRALRPQRFSEKAKVEVSGGDVLPADPKERAALLRYLADEAAKESGS